MTRLSRPAIVANMPAWGRPCASSKTPWVRQKKAAAFGGAIQRWVEVRLSARAFAVRRTMTSDASDHTGAAWR